MANATVRWARVAGGTLLLATAGCAPAGMLTRAVSYKVAPTLDRARRSAPESNVLVWGSLLPPATRDTYVLAVAGDAEAPEVVALDQVDTEGRFWLWLAPASYRLLAFSDRNDDGILQRHELVGRAKGPITAARTSSNHGLISHADVRLQAKDGADAGFELQWPLARRQGPRPPSTAGSLDDPRFAADVGRAGMLAPVDFFQRVGPVHFLGEPDFSGRKVPVIFVHGMDGTPRSFRDLAARLDSSRYQAWFFYYPSGARLETCAALLDELFFSGHVLPRMPVYALVAHSMGGLVTREALNYEAERVAGGSTARDGSSVAFYASFASPYGGVETANLGLHYSPVRLASWIDVASGSRFLEGLFRTPLPSGARFSLFAASSEGDSDGVIPLASQLFVAARGSADHVSTHDASHVGILSADDALSSFVAQLDQVTQRIQETSTAPTVPPSITKPEHDLDAQPVPLPRTDDEHFGGPGAPPPFTAFVGLGPTLGSGDIDYLVHLIVQLNFFYGHVGLGIDGLPSVFNPVRRHEGLKTQFSATLLGTGPRLRLGGDSSWIGLDVGGNAGVVFGTTASGGDDVAEEDLFAEGHLERDTVGAAWLSTTLSVRLLHDFYARGGVWAGSTFRPLRVATREERIASWGVLFGNASIGLEVRLP